MVKHSSYFESLNFRKGYIYTSIYITVTLHHTGHVTTRYMIYHPSSNSEESKKLPDDGRLLPTM
jgi:hypothetical protein